MQRRFIKKCFLFMLGSVCLVKRFLLGGKRFADDEKVERTVKRLLFCGFRRTGKAMGQVYQCWWRIRREINVFFFPPGSNITCFTFYIHLWPIY
jgi:hypothetical protein